MNCEEVKLRSGVWRSTPIRTARRIAMQSDCKPLPALEVLNELFVCDPEAGLLYWKDDRSGKVRPGDRAGGLNSNGYVVTRVEGGYYLVHRLIWFLVQEADPVGYHLDHINRVRHDNRLVNLRLDLWGEANSWNKKRYTTNTSGEKGVHQRKDTGKWRAYVSVNKKQVTIGTFDQKEDAIRAVRAARARLHGGWANHGEDSHAV